MFSWINSLCTTKKMRRSKRTKGGYLAKSMKKPNDFKKPRNNDHRKTRRIMSSMLPNVLNH